MNTDGSGRVRMTDVARRAGVSPTTVSFVLSGRDDMRISESTRQKVLRAARDLDYRPNLVARGLRTRESRLICLISDTLLTEQYAGELIRGALHAAAEHRHSLVVSETGEDSRLETTQIEDMVSRQVDGFIYATTTHRKVEVPRSLAGRPLVLLNCTADGQVPSVVPDEVLGGRDAARVLVDAGHTQDIHLVGETPPANVPAQGRLQGLRSALAEAGSGLAGHLECNWWPESAFDAVTGFLGSGHTPAALVCLNDRIALGTLEALAAAGLRVPEDVSVVSFDDSPLASWLRPALTSIALPHLQMGRMAVELLLDDAAAPDVHRVRMPVRRRGSVAALVPKGRRRRAQLTRPGRSA